MRLRLLGRKVVEGEQRLAILDQALDCLVVFNAPGLDEGVSPLFQRRPAIWAGLGALAMDDALRTQQTAADRVRAVGVDGVPDDGAAEAVEQPSARRGPGFILSPLW